MSFQEDLYQLRTNTNQSSASVQTPIFIGTASKLVSVTTIDGSIATEIPIVEDGLKFNFSLLEANIQYWKKVGIYTVDILDSTRTTLFISTELQNENIELSNHVYTCFIVNTITNNIVLSSGISQVIFRSNLASDKIVYSFILHNPIPENIDLTLTHFRVVITYVDNFLAISDNFIQSDTTVTFLTTSINAIQYDNLNSIISTSLSFYYDVIDFRFITLNSTDSIPDWLINIKNNKLAQSLVQHRLVSSSTVTLMTIQNETALSVRVIIQLLQNHDLGYIITPLFTDQSLIDLMNSIIKIIVSSEKQWVTSFVSMPQMATINVGSEIVQLGDIPPPPVILDPYLLVSGNNTLTLYDPTGSVAFNFRQSSDTSLPSDDGDFNTATVAYPGSFYLDESTGYIYFTEMCMLSGVWRDSMIRRLIFTSPTTGRIDTISAIRPNEYEDGNNLWETGIVKQGNYLYTVDGYYDVIWKTPINGGQRVKWTTNPIYSLYGWPMGMTLMPAGIVNQYIWQKINNIQGSFKSLTTLGGWSLNPADFNNPYIFAATLIYRYNTSENSYSVFTGTTFSYHHDGSPGSDPYTNAAFEDIRDGAWGTDNYLYVIDSNLNNTRWYIRKVNQSGGVTTLYDSVNMGLVGAGRIAIHPTTHEIYVADIYYIYKITQAGVKSIVAGNSLMNGLPQTDGIGLAIGLAAEVLCFNASGSLLYFLEPNSLRSFDLVSGQVTTIAGHLFTSAPWYLDWGTYPMQDGTGSNVTFNTVPGPMIRYSSNIYYIFNSGKLRIFDSSTGMITTTKLSFFGTVFGIDVLSPTSAKALSFNNSDGSRDLQYIYMRDVYSAFEMYVSDDSGSIYVSDDMGITGYIDKDNYFYDTMSIVNDGTYLYTLAQNRDYNWGISKTSTTGNTTFIIPQDGNFPISSFNWDNNPLCYYQPNNKLYLVDTPNYAINSYQTSGVSSSIISLTIPLSSVDTDFRPLNLCTIFSSHLTNTIPDLTPLVPLKRVGGWGGVTISSDGTKIAVFDFNHNRYIYTSSNSGTTWTKRLISNTGDSWNGIASSSDGSKIIAGEYASSNLYISTNSGVTWTPHDLNTDQYTYSCGNIAMSSDGSIIISSTRDSGYPIISRNGGTSWTPYTSSDNLGIGTHALSISNDGTRIIGIASSGYFYTSLDTGVSWTQHSESIGATSWYSCKISRDGSFFIIIRSDGTVYTSTDLGTTWNNVSNIIITDSYLPTSDAIAISITGNHIYLLINKSELLTSTDYGATWNQLTGFPAKEWQGIACSADGSKLVACASSGIVSPDSGDYIYYSTDYGVTWTII